jgi:hypothetical protein
MAMWAKRAPAPKDAPVAVSKFVASGGFQKLEETDQRAYMDAMRKDKKEVAKAYAGGQISASEYEKALLAAWIGRSMTHMEEYAKLKPGTPREQFLNRLVKKGEEKRKATTKPSPSTIYDQDPYDLDEVKKMVAGWPPERREQWDALRDALRQARQQRKLQTASGIWY